MQKTIVIVLISLISLLVLPFLTESKLDDDPVVKFEDRRLEYMVRVKAKKLIGGLRVSDVDDIEIIWSQRGDIGSLSGIENCKGLKSFWVSQFIVDEVIPRSRRWVSIFIGINYDPYLGAFDFLTFKDIKSFLKLDKGSKGYYKAVDDLSPLSGLTALVGLGLGGHNVSDLKPLSGLKNLKSLSLWVNEIEDITPLASDKNLRFLDLYGNYISDLGPISDLTALEKLGLDDNEITDISALEGLTAVSSLNLSVNNISDISPLSDLVNLKYLDISKNNIIDISSIRNLPELEYFHCDDNNIRDFSPLAGNIIINDLSIYSNNLEDISFLATMPNLMYVALGYNNINDISPLAGLTKLYTVILNNNKVTDLTALVENCKAGGLGLGDDIWINDNPLSDKARTKDIPFLKSRGVNVHYNNCSE